MKVIIYDRAVQGNGLIYEIIVAEINGMKYFNITNRHKPLGRLRRVNFLFPE